jgi:hypothetical protein
LGQGDRRYGDMGRGDKERGEKETRRGDKDGKWRWKKRCIRYSILAFYIELFDNNKYFSIRCIDLRVLFTFGTIYPYSLYDTANLNLFSKPAFFLKSSTSIQK